MVTIRKQSVPGGHVYRIEDFDAYVLALRKQGIEPPLARFNVFVSHENEQLIQETLGNWELQIALLFKLDPASKIPYEIIAEPQEAQP